MKLFCRISIAFLIAASINPSSDCLAQDTLRLLNGNVLEIKFINLSGVGINYTEMYKGRSINRTDNLDKVFSYQIKGEEEKLIYKYNPEEGNDYKVDEMRDYMTGLRHADRYYQSKIYNYIGLASGIGVGYLLAEDESPLLFASPLIYSSIVLSTGVKVRKNEKNAKLIDIPAYRDGYKKVAKGKKGFKAFASHGIGMLASFLVFSAID